MGGESGATLGRWVNCSLTGYDCFNGLVCRFNQPFIANDPISYRLVCCVAMKLENYIVPCFLGRITLSTFMCSAESAPPRVLTLSLGGCERQEWTPCTGLYYSELQLCDPKKRPQAGGMCILLVEHYGECRALFVCQRCFIGFDSCFMSCTLHLAQAATVQVTETAAAIKKPATMPLHLPGSVIRKQVMLHRAEQMGQTGVEAFASFDAADSELSDDFSEDDEPKDADEATLAESDAAKLRSMAGIRADSTASSAASKGRAPLFGAHDSEDTPSSAPEPLKSAVPGRAPEQPHGHPGSAASAAAAAFERKYPSYARGLLDSLIQLEERKVE